MPPKKLPKSKMGFFCVRAKPSGHFDVEFSDAGLRFWLGTYTTPNKAACAYDVAVWHARRPKKDLNFLEIETGRAEFLVPEGIQMEEIPKKRPSIVLGPGDCYEAEMARFAREHPEYVQAKQEYFWKTGRRAEE
ncbi:ethylene-responsive transcription factor RAP2-3-like [Aegilops tauschii subsp. strangulata]|uniref:ethylene-responsive transcription factor RAP2-3-like n=1 Tax=Aegilops tauschii subsp. strangulata TaxID=200361 RepID=UPI00098B0AA4|nr:ethylene-responsive transcription factor ERF071-like [Aegilops tauschii subsp. strangulata]